MTARPRRVADSWLEIVRTAFAVAGGIGTVFLVGSKVGWW